MSNEDDLFSVYMRLRRRINMLTLSLTIVAIMFIVAALSLLGLFDKIQAERRDARANTANEIRTLACSVVVNFPNGTSTVTDQLRTTYNCPAYKAPPKPKTSPSSASTEPVTPSASSNSNSGSEQFLPYPKYTPQVVVTPSVIVVEPTQPPVSPAPALPTPTPSVSASPTPSPTCTTVSALGIPIVGLC